MNNNTRMPLVIWWIIWASFLTGIFTIYYVIGAAQRGGAQAEGNSIIWLAGAAPLVISAVIRWLVLPRATEMRQAFVLFIVGIALAEMCCFLGLFIFPAHKLELFILSILGILQFAPVFATNYAGE